MKHKALTPHLCFFNLLCLVVTACSPASVPSATQAVVSTSTAPSTPALRATLSPSLTATLATTPVPAVSPTPTLIPTVESLKAAVTADLLSCRYGPGPNYLFLYGLRKGANIVLVGRTDETNWRWVYVQGKNKCWVKTDFLDIKGNWTSLPIVYPGMAKLPISPYYPPTHVLHAVRKQDQVTVEWVDVPLRAGDEEDERMQHYIVEVWRCENQKILFEPLVTNELSVTFIDQPGCNTPSHGRIFVQEKHGFAGPTNISWPSP